MRTVLTKIKLWWSVLTPDERHGNLMCVGVFSYVILLSAVLYLFCGAS